MSSAVRASPTLLACSWVWVSLCKMLWAEEVLGWGQWDSQDQLWEGRMEGGRGRERLQGQAEAKR